MTDWVMGKKDTPATNHKEGGPATSQALSPVWSVAGSLLSGLLLAVSFPGFGQASLAFIALVPLMFSVWSATARRAALLGLLTGFVFFMLSMMA